MTIFSVATVPSTALLIPEIAAGAACELDALRHSALQRVKDLVKASDRLLVIAGTGQVTTAEILSHPWSASLTPLGFNGEIPLQPSDSYHAVKRPADDVPTAVAVAGWFLHQVCATLSREYVVVPPQSQIDPAVSAQVFATVDGAMNERLGVLVVADGSATRTPKAPGAFVEGAVLWDDRWLEAWQLVDCEWFTNPARTDDAQRFMVDGVGAWSLAADVIARTKHAGTERHLTEQHWTAQMDHRADPYGVMYPVGGWTRRP
jgi:hypothetical protein